MNMNTASERTGLSSRVSCRVSLLSMIGLLVCAGYLSTATGCRDLQRRRVEVNKASGADADLEDRFGLTADAQDPSERDKEMGYGRWKQKPETEGTASPTDPSRRKPIGSP
ncbi:MAG: hypothetical protein JJ974_06345 [Phycisphaerales bacterium]|nr:hypothetical protein [Phycisphaerales bacterium]